jgi:hypothetical protein
LDKRISRDIQLSAKWEEGIEKKSPLMTEQISTTWYTFFCTVFSDDLSTSTISVFIFIDRLKWQKPVFIYKTVNSNHLLSLD